MKKIIYSALFLVLVAGVSVLIAHKYNTSKSVNLAGYKSTHTLVEKDGTFLGNVYVKYINGEIFADLYILDKDDEVLYEINKYGFFSTKGKDMEIEKEGFYGYRMVLKSNDRFVVSYLRRGGEDISDDITIRWNHVSNAFGVLKDPLIN